MAETETEALQEIDADMAALGLTNETPDDWVPPDEIDDAQRDFIEVVGGTPPEPPKRELPTADENPRSGWHVKTMSLNKADALLEDGWEPFAAWSGSMMPIVAMRKYVD